MQLGSLLTRENIVSSPIQDGDAGIVLKPDGTFQVFSTGRIDGENLTSEQELQGQKLMALAVALKFPQVMSLLLDMANDPEIVGAGIDLGKTN